MYCLLYTSHVVIASGRALSAIPEDVLNIRGLEYIITSNGSSIFELPDSRRIYANDMKPGVVMSVLAIMRDTHFPFEVFIGGHAYTMQAYYDCPTDFGVPERMKMCIRDRSICDRICAISFGKFLACGTPSEIQGNAQVQEAYLGAVSYTHLDVYKRQV